MANNETTNSEIAHLVSMANDIAANLSFHSDVDERIADHINRFWAPRMRSLLIKYASAGGQNLSEAMLPVLSKLKASSKT